MVVKSKGNPLISGKSRLVKHHNLARCIWMFPKKVGFPAKLSIWKLGFSYFHHPFWGFYPLFLETFRVEKRFLGTKDAEHFRNLWKVETC